MRVESLFENNEPTTCKEAMMGPDSVKWLEAIKSVIVPYTRNQVLNLEDPPERCINLSVVFGSIKKQTWMFYIYEIVDMLGKSSQQCSKVDYDKILIFHSDI